MSKFEEIGINNLMKSKNQNDLLKRKEWSCNACVCRGMRLKCDRCGINSTFDSINAIMDDQQTEEYKPHKQPAYKRNPHGTRVLRNF